METIRTWSSFLVVVLMLVGCAATTPPSRLGQYVPVASSTDAIDQLLPTSRPVHAALVVLADRSAPGAAPVIPEPAQDRLAGLLGEQISQGFPLRIDRVVNLGEIPVGSAPKWTEIASQQGVGYLVVVVLSSTEQEYPASLFLGWTTHRQPGFRRDNWSLAEAALVDGRTGDLLLSAEGRAMATLDSPTAPGINQWYPVIYLRPQDPERRIWPPSYEGAPLTLRVVSMEQAVKRLAGNLQRAWVERRDVELAVAAQP
ncbi:MAG TPA: hypothetical protein VM842_03570 [Nitrospira sp.]|nr:hypothetical protein [Nitrospira sp.]